jgi:hypothetical protein
MSSYSQNILEEAKFVMLIKYFLQFETDFDKAIKSRARRTGILKINLANSSFFNF